MLALKRVCSTGFSLLVTRGRHVTAKAAGLKQRLDLVSVMLTIIVAGALGYVGIRVMSDTESTSGVAANHPLENSQDNLTGGVESFFSQLGTVFVVIVLVVIIGYLMLLRNR